MATTRKNSKAKSPKLSRSELKRIAALGDTWQLDEKHKKLTASFDFERYLDAFMFATRISVHAEVLAHHPELCITHNKVKVTLTTEDQKTVTELDIRLAERIAELLSTHR